MFTRETEKFEHFFKTLQRFTVSILQGNLLYNLAPETAKVVILKFVLHFGMNNGLFRL